MKNLQLPATERPGRLKVQQTTTPSTRSIYTPNSFEQQQPSNQIQIQEQEVARLQRNKKATQTQPNKDRHDKKTAEQNHQEAEGDLNSLNPRP